MIEPNMKLLEAMRDEANLCYKRGDDEDGNALREKAIEDIDLEREEKKKADPKAYNMMVTQHPHTPKEAFLRNEGAVFPAIELYNVLAKLKQDERYKKLGTAGTLFEEEGEVRFRPDLNKKLEGITFIKPNLLTPILYFFIISTIDSFITLY